MAALVRIVCISILLTSLADAQAWRTKWNWFGISAARLGELDGRPNIVVAAPTTKTIYQFSGIKSGEPLRRIVGGSWVGMQMCSMGDIDGDGVDDFAASTFEQEVRVIDGRLGELRYTVPSSATMQRPLPFSFALHEPIDTLADLDCDGVRELIVGLSSGSAGGFAIFSGNDGRLIRAERTPGEFFRGVVGDIDGDGREDLLYSTNEVADELPIDVTYSVRSSADLRALWTNVVRVPSIRPRFAHAALGDIDGDGIADVAIGICDVDDGVDGRDRSVHDPLAFPDYPTFAGRVVILSGENGREIRTLSDGSKWNLFGYSVANAGDVDLDGCSDILVASYVQPSANVWNGTVALFSGRSGELIRRWKSDGPIGAFVGGLGDVNNDGFPDQCVGAVWDNVGAAYEDGALFVLSGFDGSVLAHWGEPRFSIRCATR